MKINFFFAWTRNKDKSNEYTNALGGGFKLPSFLGWLKLFKRKKK